MQSALSLFLAAVISADLSTKSLVVQISCSDPVSQLGFLKGQKCFPLTRVETRHRLCLRCQALEQNSQFCFKVTLS